MFSRDLALYGPGSQDSQAPSARTRAESTVGGWPGGTTRTSPSPVGCCRGGCGSTSTTSTPTAAGPTTWPTRPGDPQRSLALLDWWEKELRDCYAGKARHPVFVALADTIRQFDIPIDPFVDLLVAFRQDQRVRRYDDLGQLPEYCRYSANPVGRLVLYLGKCHTPERAQLSDSICTGLQLANFWQDVARDYDMGRVYLPAADCARFGYDDEMLARREVNDAFRRLMAAEVDLAEGYLRRGLPLVRWMPPELQLDVALFIHGGLAILRAIRRAELRRLDLAAEVSQEDEVAAACGMLVGIETRPGSGRRDMTLPRTKSSPATKRAAPDVPGRLEFSGGVLPVAAGEAAGDGCPLRLHAAQRRPGRRSARGTLAGRGLEACGGGPRNSRSWDGRFPERAPASIGRPRPRDPAGRSANGSRVLHPAGHRFWRSWTAWRWTSSRGFTRPSTNWPSIASGWRRRSAWPAFTSGGSWRATSSGPAAAAGLALQLTNILRDLSEDARRGRVYLPLDDIHACGYSAEELRDGVVNRPFLRLMEMEIERAEQFYREAAELTRSLHKDGHRIFGLMMATYHSLLDAIRRHPADVFARRIRVSRWKKLWLAARWTLLPVRPDHTTQQS